MSFHNLLENFGKTANDRVEAAIEALKKGRGILVVDNEGRENEGDLIYAAETVTVKFTNSYTSKKGSLEIQGRAVKESFWKRAP